MLRIYIPPHAAVEESSVAITGRTIHIRTQAAEYWLSAMSRYAAKLPIGQVAEYATGWYELDGSTFRITQRQALALDQYEPVTLVEAADDDPVVRRYAAVRMAVEQELSKLDAPRPRTKRQGAAPQIED